MANLKTASGDREGFHSSLESQQCLSLWVVGSIPTRVAHTESDVYTPPMENPISPARGSRAAAQTLRPRCCLP